MVSNVWEIPGAGLQLALEMGYPEQLSLRTLVFLLLPPLLPLFTADQPSWLQSTWAAPEDISQDQPQLQIPKEEVGLASDRGVHGPGPVACGDGTPGLVGNVSY